MPRTPSKSSNLRTRDARSSLLSRITQLNWDQLGGELLENGFTLTPKLLTVTDCTQIEKLFGDEAVFRSTIRMERYNFGHGVYRYFDYELPPIIEELRSELYRHLAPIANQWSIRLRSEPKYPATHKEFRQQMVDVGQTRPTPLLLKYVPGDFNCVHYDVSGKIYFPYQVIFALSRPDVDYTGGHVVLLQQRPRMQTVPHVIDIPRGHALILASHQHPQLGKRGYYKTTFKHGVSKLLTGERYTLGIIFHDYQERKKATEE
jgi:hypothetical protein